MALIHYAAARSQVNAHFGVTSVDELTIAQCKEAIQWVQGKIGGIQKALPEPETATQSPAETMTTAPVPAPQTQSEFALALEWKISGLRMAVNQIHDMARDIYAITARRMHDTNMKPARIDSLEHSLAIRTHYCTEALFDTLTSAINAVKENALAMHMAARVNGK